MFKLGKHFALFSVLATALAGAAAHAACIPISSVPYTISQSGSYCVTADLSTSLPDRGTAVSIIASNVDLDFQGHSITNTPTAYRSFGVHITGTGRDLTDVIVHNGILSGFFTGIGGRVSNSTIDQMTVAYSTFVGIAMSGPNVRITNNKVLFTTGLYQAMGISAEGSFGIAGYKASNRAVIQGNRLSKTYATSTVQAWATGIAINDFTDILIRDNSVINTSAGVGVADSAIVGIGISQTRSLCDLSAPCDKAPVSGLIVQDNIVGNSVTVARVSSINSVGIQIEDPADHAIVTGSTITLMVTGIAAASKNNFWANTPPVLLLNNSILGATTPTIGGVTLPQ